MEKVRLSERTSFPGIPGNDLGGEFCGFGEKWNFVGKREGVSTVTFNKLAIDPEINILDLNIIGNDRTENKCGTFFRRAVQIVGSHFEFRWNITGFVRAVGKHLKTMGAVSDIGQAIVNGNITGVSRGGEGGLEVLKVSSWA